MAIRPSLLEMVAHRGDWTVLQVGMSTDGHRGISRFSPGEICNSIAVHTSYLGSVQACTVQFRENKGFGHLGWLGVLAY